MSDDIKAITETIIKTKILEAFNSSSEVIEKLVAASLEREVSEWGGKPEGFGSRKMPYLDYLIGNEIRIIVEQSVRELIRDSEAKIKEAVQRKLTSDDIGAALVGRLVDVATEDWKLKVEVVKDR